METFRLDPTHSLQQIAKYYEPYDMSEDKKSADYQNKYFVMLYNDKLNDRKDINDRK